MKIMTLSVAEDKLQQLKNNLERLSNEKKLNFNKTQPISKQLTGDSVSGGKRTDKMINYAIKNEQIEKEMQEIEEEADLLVKFIDAEQRRINNAPDKKQKVITLREKGKSWNYISATTGIPDRTCRDWYYKFKGVDNEKNN